MRVQVDESQFVIESCDGLVRVSDDVGVGWVDVRDGLVFVESGAQWGPVEVTSRVHEGPPELRDDSDEIVELSVITSAGLRVTELFGDPRLTITSRSGEFRIRVSASGRDEGARRWQSGPRSKILERFVVDVWPAPVAAPSVLREVVSVEVPDPVVEHEAAGRAAAARVDNDLNNGSTARTLSGQTGTITVSCVFAATRRKLFPQLAQLDLWLGDGGSGSQPRYGEQGVDGGYIVSNSVLGGTRGGCIWGEYTAFDSPGFVESTWNWRIPDHENRTSWDKWMPSLPVPSVLRVDLVQHRVDDTTGTTVTLIHSRLPIEWCDDIGQFWRWKLEQGEKIFQLGRY